MPAPTNISYGTATDLGSTFPTVVTQQIDNAGTYYTVFYKITIAAAGVYGFWIYGTDDFDYIARTTIRSGPSDVSPQVDSFASIDDGVMVVMFPAAGTYYFKIEHTGPQINTPAILTIDIDVPTNSSPSNNDLLIADDSVDHPLGILNQFTGEIRQYISNFPTGEYGISFLDFVVFLDQNDDKMYIYDNSFALLNTVDAWPGQSGAQQTNAFLGSNHSSNVYWGVADNGAGVCGCKKIRVSDGSVLATLSPLFGSVVFLLGADANSGDTILYYSEYNISTPTAIKKWDIVNNLALTDLVTGLTGYRTLDICCLDDGTVLALYFKITLDDVVVKHYSAAGAVLNTYTFGDINTGTSIPRMCGGADNQDSFWLYLKGGGGGGDTSFSLLQIRVSDGVTLSSFLDQPITRNGVIGGATIGTDDPARFAPSPSCPVMAFVSDTVTGEGGLYIQTTQLPLSSGGASGSTTPARTNDELFTGLDTTAETAIPQPQVIIYPAGD